MNKVWLITFLSSFVSAMDNPTQQPTKEEYELFKVVQTIQEIARESREEIRRTMGFDDPRPIAQSELNEHFGQTEKGIFIEMAEFPEEMHTPWGCVEIVEQVTHPSDYRASLAASQLF